MCVVCVPELYPLTICIKVLYQSRPRSVGQRAHQRASLWFQYQCKAAFMRHRLRLFRFEDVTSSKLGIDGVWFAYPSRGIEMKPK